MTLKSYLRMLLAAVTLMFVTTGCNDDEEKVGPPPSYTFGIAVSDVTETEATVTVTPSNDQATYYYGAVKKADFDAFESDAAYAQNILATLKAAADRKVLSLEEYLQTALSKGSSPKKIADLMAGTDYYAVAIGILTDGRFTSDLVKEAFKTVAAPEPAPELTLTMKAGDPNGANLSSAITCIIKSSDIVSAKGSFYLKANVDEALAAGQTIEQYLANDEKASSLNDYLNAINGSDGLAFYTQAPANTEITAIISVTNSAGKTTVKSVSGATAPEGDGGDGPNLTITAIPGKEGADTQTYITAMFKVTGTPAAVSGSYILAEKALVDQLVAEKGLTYEQITEAAGNEFTADNLTKLNANGVGWYFKELTPGTEHIVMAKVTDAAGNSTFKYVLASTDPAGEASDAYKAWLGTWTLTSTSSEVNKASLSFDVTFVQGVANSSYKLQGWGITTLREQTEIVPSARFDNATGNFEILEGQELYTDPEDGSVLTLTARGLLQGKYYIINGGYPGFTGALSADKNSATITMYQGTVDGLGTFTTSSMEFFWFHPNGEDIYGQKAAAGYTDGDYPIGPYTMTRKSASTSMPALKSAAHAGTLMHAGKLSSVLSASAVVSAPVKQNLVEAKASVLNSLTFEKPAGVYEATISTLQISRSL